MDKSNNEFNVEEFLEKLAQEEYEKDIVDAILKEESKEI